MKDAELEQSVIRHAKDAIAKSQDEAMKTYGMAVMLPAEMAKTAHMEGEYLDQFLKELDAINAQEDTLLLVCLGMVYSMATSNKKNDLLLPELSEDTLGFVMLQYNLVKKQVNTERAAELSSNNQSGEAVNGNKEDELMKDFEWLVSVTIGRFYKRSPLWKQKLMWKLVKEWNSRRFSMGIPKQVRDKLGEDESLELFRDTANRIMSDSDLLDKAVKDYHESNPYAGN